jgi:hypothetical protein
MRPGENAARASAAVRARLDAREWLARPLLFGAFVARGGDEEWTC